MFARCVKILTNVPKLFLVQPTRYMEALQGTTLLDIKGNNVQANTVLQNTQYVLYYFSASWCQACKSLLPLIKNLHQEILKRNIAMEIIYVSFDKDGDLMVKYFKENHGKWYAIPFGTSLTDELRVRFDVTYIPFLTLIKKDGTVISKNAKSEIEELGINVLTTWLS